MSSQEGLDCKAANDFGRSAPSLGAQPVHHKTVEKQVIAAVSLTKKEKHCKRRRKVRKRTKTCLVIVVFVDKVDEISLLFQSNSEKLWRDQQIRVV